jgi:cell division septal protein FtsQ
MEQLNQVKKQEVNEEHSESQLKGTFASVLILGGFILGCWLFVFILFMIRNGG